MKKTHEEELMDYTYRKNKGLVKREEYIKGDREIFWENDRCYCCVWDGEKLNCKLEVEISLRGIQSKIEGLAREIGRGCDSKKIQKIIEKLKETLNEYPNDDGCKWFNKEMDYDTHKKHKEMEENNEVNRIMDIANSNLESDIEKIKAEREK